MWLLQRKGKTHKYAKYGVQGPRTLRWSSYDFAQVLISFSSDFTKKMEATCNLSPCMLLHMSFLGLPSVIVSFCYITNYHKFSRLKQVVILVSVCQELSSDTGDSSSLMRSQGSCWLGRWLLVASVVVEHQLLRWLTHTTAGQEASVPHHVGSAGGLHEGPQIRQPNK